MQQVAIFTLLYHFHNALGNTLVTATLEQAVISFVVVVAVTILAALLSIIFTRWKDF